MIFSSLLLAAAPCFATAHCAPQDRREVVMETYHALAKIEDLEGLADLWKQNRGLVLQTIDADLEGGLSLWEKSPEKPPVAEISALQTRAMFGARAASLAFSQPIFTDYASSFVGWDNAQKQAFRAGQQVYGRAAKELKDGNHETAFEAGKETVERASALGDWWGTAMGYGAQAEAARNLGWFEDALVAYGMARQINHALGLEYSEYRNLQGMLAASRAAERDPRSLVIATDLAAYARAFADTPILKTTLSAKAQLEEKLGHTSAATKTKDELSTLK
ncbi:MAG: hypothetical protein ACI9F9_002723 [Candidatus Paceibacteria bacterium]|jgi:hypothetical protein